jgi:hypothetical protein
MQKLIKTNSKQISIGTNVTAMEYYDGVKDATQTNKFSYNLDVEHFSSKDAILDDMIATRS